MQRGIVWIVDDDSSIRWVLERALTGAGLSCETFDSASEVLDADRKSGSAGDRKSTRLNSSHSDTSRMPSSA